MRISEAMVIASAIDTSDEKVWEAVVTLIEAAKKQEPMKPKVDGEFGLCWECNYVFDSELISEFCVKHCPNCGQKLDWDDWTED